MAEFVEVMKQARRLCKEQQHIDCCVRCPMQGKEGCMVVADVEKIDYVEAERKIMDWAAEHPEPVYPSWEEAWTKLFPYACEVPCPRKYFDKDCFPIFICAEHDCDRCKALPMYPKIAEKLGIKPKEE